MEPIADTDIQELVLFLKRDYANNLYFFTYLDGTGWRKPREPGVTVLVGRETGAITVAILISPVHCCVSASHIDQAPRRRHGSSAEGNIVRLLQAWPEAPAPAHGLIQPESLASRHTRPHTFLPGN